MSLMKEGTNSRILIVDDNRAIHQDFQRILRARRGVSEARAALIFGDDNAETADPNLSFQVDSAYQGQEALERLKQAVVTQARYALAFVDVRMPPGWDGIETTAKLWEVDPELQVVICTAYSDYSWEQTSRKLNLSDRMVILKKPFDNIEVLQLATSLTRKWQLLQETKTRMSELTKMAEELAERNQQLVAEMAKRQRAQDELIQASRQAAKAEVAAGILHNVRNVLNSVNVSIGLLGERAKKDQTNRRATAGGPIKPAKGFGRLLRARRQRHPGPRLSTRPGSRPRQ